MRAGGCCPLGVEGSSCQQRRPEKMEGRPLYGAVNSVSKAGSMPGTCCGKSKGTPVTWSDTSGIEGRREARRSADVRGRPGAREPVLPLSHTRIPSQRLVFQAPLQRHKGCRVICQGFGHSPLGTGECGRGLTDRHFERGRGQGKATLTT